MPQVAGLGLGLRRSQPHAGVRPPYSWQTPRDGDGLERGHDVIDVIDVDDDDGAAGAYSEAEASAWGAAARRARVRAGAAVHHHGRQPRAARRRGLPAARGGLRVRRRRGVRRGGRARPRETARRAQALALGPERRRARLRAPPRLREDVRGRDEGDARAHARGRAREHGAARAAREAARHGESVRPGHVVGALLGRLRHVRRLPRRPRPRGPQERDRAVHGGLRRAQGGRAERVGGVFDTAAAFRGTTIKTGLGAPARWPQSAVLRSSTPSPLITRREVAPRAEHAPSLSLSLSLLSGDIAARCISASLRAGLLSGLSLR